MTHRQRWAKRRTTHPDNPAQAKVELDRIKTRLTQEGYKVRRSDNDVNAWRITSSDIAGCYLLRFITPGEWKLQPNDGNPQRERLIKLVEGAVLDTINLPDESL